LITCSKESMFDCFKSAGNNTTIVREMPFFNKVMVTDKVDVILIQENVFKVRLEGGENLLGSIKTDVANSTLSISNNNSCDFVRSYDNKISVYVSAPSFNEINHSGLGEVSCQTVLTTDTIIYRVKNAGDLYLSLNNKCIKGDMNGNGDIIATGQTLTHILNAQGECHLKCGNLVTQVSDYYLGTSGPAFLNVNQSLNVTIKNTGNVFYNGNPVSINKNITGSGKLIQGF
jgi:hypothetical protein